jgi:diaminopimelate decarboxylase
MKRIYQRPTITRINEGMPSKFGSKTYLRPITQIDGVTVDELIKKYGSPVYVISERTIRNRYKKLYRAFSTRYPKVQLAWSYKTNYLDAVCRIFHQEGSWAEVVSGFEYQKALDNGVSGDNIIFNGPSKSREDLILAIKNQSFIHIDHFDELYTIIELSEELDERPQVAIRINMDTGIYPQWDRFGFNYENGEAWTAINRLMMNEKIDLIGLHAHIGTYMMSAKPYEIAAKKLAELAKRIEKKWNHKITYIDLGGGFASHNTLKGAYLPGRDTNPSFDDYAEAITNALIAADFDPTDMPYLYLETGRALIDDAGYILGTVLANKRLADGRRASILDVGVNLLFTSFWYEHEIFPAKDLGYQTEETVLYGPLCMNIDVIRKNIHFPLLNKGDHFVIKRIGAYNMTQWMQFITLRPKIVLIDTNSDTHIIRENETNEVFKSMESIPQHLK